MGEDRTDQPDPTNQRVTVPEAAELLGITAEAVRMRIKRGTLRSERQAGRVFVLLGQTQPAEQPTDRPDEPNALISEMVEEMRAEVHYLRDQLNLELERRSDEAERYQQIIGALTAANASLSERLRELEPPGRSTTEGTDDAETVEEAPEGAEPQSAAGEAQDELDTERIHREVAETTLHEGMAEERRRREEAERERDDLRGQLYARSRQQGAQEAAEEQQGRGEPRPDAPGGQEGARRPWWRRMFGR